jgi:hypothetical protein
LSEGSAVLAAAMPSEMLPPMFNRYEGGQSLRRSLRCRGHAGAGRAPSSPC